MTLTTDAATPAAAGGELEASVAREAVVTVYAPAAAVDLRATLGQLGRGPYDPTTKWDARGVWRTWRTPDGPATLRLEQSAQGGAVEARAWGPGAEWAIAGVPALLGCDDDWSALDVSAHPVLAETRHRNPGLRLMRTGRVLEALAPAVLEQKVTSLEAFRSWVRLVVAFGESAPGPAPGGLRVVPSGAQWAAIPSWEWHRAGVDPQRSRTLAAAAGRAAALERAGSAGDDPAAQLTSLPGIGVWTAAETLQRSHGHPDLVSVGDYGLCHVVGFALVGDRELDDDGMLELLEPWAGQRQRVVRLILASGRMPERRGPRATITDHRGR